MLGDTGANALGAAVGIALVAGTSQGTRVGALVVVALLTVASELVSFTEVIDAVAPLRVRRSLGSAPALTRPSALRSRLLLAATVALVLAGVVAYVVGTTDRPVSIAGAGAGAAFDKGVITDTGAERGLFSPDGAQLAVITGDGVGIAAGGRVKLLTPQGSAVDDAAWMPDARSLLVIEGGAQIDRVTVLDLNGAVQGVAHLDTPIAHGRDGMAVDFAAPAPSSRPRPATRSAAPAITISHWSTSRPAMSTR